MSIYWSIDLDFWSHTRHISFSTKFFDTLLKRNVPIALVKSHGHMLSHVKKFHFDTLVNTDHHSDIGDAISGQKPYLNEGTWVNHVPWARNKTFVWYYPTAVCTSYKDYSGYCHEQYNPFIRKDASGWGDIRKEMSCIPRGNIVAIGIALSPGWTAKRHMLEFARWLSKQDRVKVYPAARKFLLTKLPGYKAWFNLEN